MDGNGVYRDFALAGGYLTACGRFDFLQLLPMRTFPKSLATFRKIICDRGEQLRKLSQEELKKLAAERPEQLIFDSRPTTIGIIVQSNPDGSIRVVIRGFMKARFILGKHVALDGFYKYPDGSVSEMPDKEFYEFD
jgi:hypothetical protein